MQGGEGLRDNPNNSCKGDYALHATNLKAVIRYAAQIAQQNNALTVLCNCVVFNSFKSIGLMWSSRVKKLEEE